MKKLLSQAMLTVFFVLIMIQLSAQSSTIYIKSDKDCTSKYHYKDALSAMEYFDYHVSLDDGEKIVLRTEKLNSFPKSEFELDGSTIYPCQSVDKNLFQSLVGNVKIKKMEVYIIEEDGTNFNVFYGTQAAYHTFSNDAYFAQTGGESYRIKYETDYIPLQDISVDRKNADILFSAKAKTTCIEKYFLVRLPSHVPVVKTNLEFVKNIGIVKEENKDINLNLVSIDGEPITQYLQKQCTGYKEEITLHSRPKPKSSLIDDLPGYVMDDSNAKGGDIELPMPKVNLKRTATIPVEYNTTTIKSTTESNNKVVLLYKYADAIEPEVENTEKGVENIIHMVDIGDTLFSLSQKYKTTIDEIKRLNGLTTNNIFVTQELKVK